MSIIYDALRKVEKFQQTTSKEKERVDKHPKFKFSLLYILIVGIGFFIANIFFNFFTKPTLIDTHTSLSTNLPPLKETIQVKESPPSQETITNKPMVLPSFVLNGVFFSGDQGYALINNRIVTRGDVIEGATVKRIDLEEVELEISNSTVKLSTPK